MPSPLLKKTNRQIDKIIIHCTATPPYRDVSAAEIDAWHKGRGWSGIGYHGLIRRDGIFEPGRDIDRVGAHAKGHNRHSIGICLVGGLADDLLPSPEYTKAQWHRLNQLISQLELQYPDTDIIGHRDVANKACPSFDVAAWLQTGEVRL